MPTPAQSIRVINFNRQNKVGKHYTAAEREARQKAEESFKREEVKLKVPDFLKEKACAPALKIFKELVKEGKEIDLFDNVDARILADYCRWQALFEEEAQKNFPDAKKIDRYGKQCLAYAEKLGLTPSSRIRLAVKKANASTDEDMVEDLMMA